MNPRLCLSITLALVGNPKIAVLDDHPRRSRSHFATHRPEAGFGGQPRASTWRSPDLQPSLLL
jgi:hypothetical protein